MAVLERFHTGIFAERALALAEGIERTSTRSGQAVLRQHCPRPVRAVEPARSRVLTIRFFGASKRASQPAATPRGAAAPGGRSEEAVEP